MQDYLISRSNSFSLDTGGLTAENLIEKSRKDFHYTDRSDTLVICLPGWNQELWSWGRVKRHVVRSKGSFLTYEFPRAILSDNQELTKECFEVINRTVREDIKKLKEQYGFSKCILVILSLASSFGSMIYKDNPDINEIVLVVLGEDLARDMWHGYRTQHLRRSFERQGITLEQLRGYWHDLASENNMPAKNTKISMYFGKQDKIIPYRFSQTLEATLEREGFKPIVKISNFAGHYFVSYKFLLFPQKFLQIE